MSAQFGFRSSAKSSLKAHIVFWIVLFVNIVIILNSIRSIRTALGITTVYSRRKAEVQKQYLELIKKKNEINYVTSPFFVEKQLRESLHYYKKGETLVVFTGDVIPKETDQEDIESPFLIWWRVLRDGISYQP